MATLEPYYGWIYERFKGYIGQYILDAGCGVGNFSALVENRATKIWAADLVPENLLATRERFRDSKNIEVVKVDFEKDKHFFYTKKIDTIVCLDVLEHIQDDLRLLDLFYRNILPEGHLLIKVPACKRLFGSIDIASGHFRRYELHELTRKCVEAGWKIKEFGYMNIAALLPYWFKNKTMKKNINFSRTFSYRQLLVIKKLIRIIMKIDSITGPPIGLSALVVAYKAEGAS
jgi:ubiquinone/menaquinone biosynthesis C-methylase UbiE